MQNFLYTAAVYTENSFDSFLIDVLLKEKSNTQNKTAFKNKLNNAFQAYFLNSHAVMACLLCFVNNANDVNSFRFTSFCTVSIVL